MRVLLFVILVLHLISAARVGGQTPAPNDLPRRADLGAVLRPPTATTPASVVRVSDNSPLQRAGLRAGDVVTSLDGTPLVDAVDFDRRLAALRGGQRIDVGVTRDGRLVTIRARLDPLPREELRGTEVAYTHITNPRGPRQRAILTRPATASGRVPAILFVPWLSCDSIESPGAAAPGIDELLLRIATDTGWALLRVDKPGVGDSEGVCADTDLETEIEGSRAALAWLRVHPWIDADRIVVMGQSFSGAFLPQIAGETPVAGYIVINSWVRTWMERLIEFERLQAESSGMTPAAVSARQRQLSEFYALFLEQQKTPREVMAARPELAPVWQDGPEHQYGRSARFHHQLQRVNPAAGWSRVAVPTLVMWGDADLVMQRTDHERLVAMVNRNRAGAAQLLVVPGADHAMAARDADGRRHLPPILMTTIRTFLDRLNVARSAG
jgi:pimeloyl-ACP methyl ester carboxylesterase